MFHIALRGPKAKELDYAKLLASDDPENQLISTNQTPNVPDDETLPEPPPGFAFYRVQNGDTLVALALKFNISQNRLRRYNREMCFGHRLGHIVGKLILVPMVNDATITKEIQEQLESVLAEDDSKQNLMEKEYKEPDENGKYQLTKALMYHARGIDVNRAHYYLGEANWNVRKALALFKRDDKWEREQILMKKCKGMSNKEAKELLERYNGDSQAAMKHWTKEQKKEEKQNANMVKQLENEKMKSNSTIDDDGIEMQTNGLISNEQQEGANNNENDKEDFTNFRKCCD